MAALRAVPAVVPAGRGSAQAVWMAASAAASVRAVWMAAMVSARADHSVAGARARAAALVAWRSESQAAHPGAGRGTLRESRHSVPRP